MENFIFCAALDVCGSPLMRFRVVIQCHYAISTLCHFTMILVFVWQAYFTAETFVRRCSIKTASLRRFARLKGKHLCWSIFQVVGLFRRTPPGNLLLLWKFQFAYFHMFYYQVLIGNSVCMCNDIHQSCYYKSVSSYVHSRHIR